MKELKFTVVCMTVFLAAIVCRGDLPVTESLIAHLDGQNVVESGGVVDSMLDLSGNDNHAVVDSGYATYKPALAAGAANGLNAVDFAGGKSLKIPSSEDFNVGEMTMFIVYKCPDTVSTNVENGILVNSYNMLDANNNPWGFNSMAVRRTVGFYGSDGKIKCNAYAQNGTSVGYEMLYPFDGFIGWNLAVVVWDPDDAELSATIDGDLDMYINPGSSRFPTLADARNNRWYESTDEAGGTYTLQGHIMTVMGGYPNYLASPNYPGTYEITQGFNGMIAEVAIYSQALVECEIQAMVDYLQAKYNCGTTAPLLELPNPSDCRYYQQRGSNVADYNGDCKVDFADFSIIADKWLSTY